MTRQEIAALRAYIATNTVVFSRPVAALPIGGGNRVFAIPGAPELALLEVGSADEIGELARGFALTDDSGLHMIAFFGKTARFMLQNPTSIPVSLEGKYGMSNSSPFPWTRPAVQVGAPRPVSAFPALGSRAAKTATLTSVNMTNRSTRQTFIDTEANVDPAYTTLSAYIRSPSEIGSSGVSVVAPLARPIKRVFAVLNKAEYGMVRCGRGDGAGDVAWIKSGFLADTVKFGSMLGPMDKVVSEFAADESIDARLRALLPTTFDRVKRSGAWDYEPFYSLVTYFGGAFVPKFGDEEVEFGLALLNPAQYSRSRPTFFLCGNEPTPDLPVGIPDLTIHRPLNVPSRLTRGTYTWHTLGQRFTQQLSVAPVTPGVPSGSWEQYVNLNGVLDVFENPLSLIAQPEASAIPAGQTVETYFNPALSQGDDADDIVRLVNNGGIVTGDAFWTYRNAARSFYREWEQTVHDRYGD